MLCVSARHGFSGSSASDRESCIEVCRFDSEKVSCVGSSAAAHLFLRCASVSLATDSCASLYLLDALEEPILAQANFLMCLVASDSGVSVFNKLDCSKFCSVEGGSRCQDKSVAAD